MKYKLSEIALFNPTETIKKGTLAKKIGMDKLQSFCRDIPDFEIANRIPKEIPKKNQLIIVYCQYGGRSRNAIMTMNKLGYNNVYNLYGGLEIL